MTQKQYKPHFEDLKNKWQDRQQFIQKTLVEKHQESIDWLHKSKQVVAGTMASVMMLSHQTPTALIAQISLPKNNNTLVESSTPKTKEQLLSELKTVLPESVEPLNEDQESKISGLFSEYFKIPVSAKFGDKRLNRSYGLIGAEQHLMRYPGDTMGSHFDTAEEADTFYSSGMAPGRGAWGYFVQSQSELSEKAKQQEKYYIAVPTFMAPGWEDNVGKLYAHFKFRKMIVVNPENGKAMVVVIGDAGPAPWTGKHLGGSPEVMHYLERKDGGARGPVLYFFVNDPEDKIPLGPIDIK
jgi:hypothetical protein